MRVGFILFLIVAGLFFTVSGQQPAANSPDMLTVGRLLDLSYDYYKNRSDQAGLDSAMLFAKKAETICTRLNYIKGIANCYIAESRVFSKTHQREIGKDYVHRAIRLFTDLRLLTDLGYAYWELAGYYDLSESQFSDKFGYIQQAVNAFHLAGNVKKEADALKELADVRQMRGDYLQSLSELKQSLKLYQSINEPQLEGIYDLVGDVSCSLGNLNDALRYGLLAVQTAERLKDTSLELCTIYNHLGSTYYYLHDHRSSATYFAKALSIAEKYGSYNDIYIISYNYGNNLIRMQKPAECNRHLYRILKKYPGIDSTELINYTCSFLQNYTLLRQFPQAEKYFNQLLSLAKDRRLTNETLPNVYVAIIKYLLASGQNKKARYYLKEEESYSAKNSNLIQLAENQLTWTDLDSAVGNYRSAFWHFRNYALLKDSIIGQEKTKYIAQLNVQYETSKKDQDILLKEKNIELLNQRSKLQNVELAKANQTRNGALAAGVLLLVIVGLLINNSQVKQRANRKLQDQQKEIEKKNISLEHLVEEKEWLVKEIHHRVKNNFHMVIALLGTQSGYLKTEEAIQAIADSQNRIQAMSIVHQKLYQSDNLSAINMANYIHDLIHYLRDTLDIVQAIQLRVDVDPVELDLTHCIPLGLIINEAVTNSIKYAFINGREGVIEISFKRVSPDGLVLKIRDNGIGLPGNLDIRKLNSMGLKLIKGLSDDIDAKLSINSFGGTEIVIGFSYENIISSHFNIHGSRLITEI
ncbi:MAG: tetratricopeptide repeat protein [Chitinophagaceae bacterium]|nr:tetratricopeptide repeat protein [Chitinophagaceae bacterium]